jgi:N-acetylmuramoyl-L-alanine amidase
MKQALAVAALALVAAATVALAQSPGRATLRSPNGEAFVSTIVIEGNLYVSADEFVLGVGGTLEQDGPGYNVSMLGRRGAFGTDSQYGVVRDELIQMPAFPVVVETRPFVPWQFFRGFVANAGELELVWEPTDQIFTIQPRTWETLNGRLSVVQIEDVSKLVVQLESKSDFAVTESEQGYVIRLANPVTLQASEFDFQNPHLSKITVDGRSITLQLTGADVIGSWYSLENPYRIVLDLKKGVAPVTAPSPGRSPRRKLPGIRTIVIDPGHGGSETGAIGPSGIVEKDITLALSNKLAGLIRSRMPVRVILTRTGDQQVDLTQRTALANEYAADLFVSIHLNASLRKGATGTETYFLSLEASDDLARQAAERENADETGAIDPTSDLKLILWDLAQQQYLKDSSTFAEAVQDELSRATATENRGVKQAPFRVLIGATMPAALVEVGFISNPDEEQRLAGDDYQLMLAEAIYRGIERFKVGYEERIGIRPAAPPTAPPTPTGTSTNTPSRED